MATIEERIKSSKQKLGEKIPCSIEVLTPVHIGSGVKLANKIDFKISEDKQRLTIINQSDLIKYLEENPDEIENFLSNKLEKLKKTPDGKTYNINGNYVGEIYQFERDGNGKPYVPGSSIKGAIRTAILVKLFSDLSQEEREKILNEAKDLRKGENWASEPIVNEIFGSDSNYNLMRTLQVNDAYSRVDVDLEHLHLMSLKSENEYGWKKMGKDKKTNQPFPLQTDPKYSTSIFVEALSIGTKDYFSMNLDNFLLDNQLAKNELKFKEGAINAVRNLTSIINLYSIEKLKSEKQFFEKLTTPKKLNLVIKEIDNLIKKIENLSKDEFIMRISWGSGWKGMTGDYLDNNWLNIFRQKYRLGRQNLPFPKTRRIVFEENEPKYLTGWIKVKLNVIAEKENKNFNEEEASMDVMERLKQKFNVKEIKKNKTTKRR